MRSSHGERPFGGCPTPVDEDIGSKIDQQKVDINDWPRDENEKEKITLQKTKHEKSEAMLL